MSDHEPSSWLTAISAIERLEADLAAARRENATLREALERIAESYPWEQYEDGERVYVSDEDYFEEFIPTNRRIARAALAASPHAEEPQP